ncbi:hypothetical protein JCM8097_007945 [Rhodosporidiobolus ruineniae]
MSLEYSSKVTIDWTIEGINELLAQGETKDIWHQSPPFEDGRWCLALQLYPPGGEHVGIFLVPLLSHQERQGVGEASLTSRGHFRCTVKLYSPSGTALAQDSFAHEYGLDGASWGWPQMVKRNALREATVHEQNALTFHAELELSKPVKPTRNSVPNSSLLVTKLFNNITYADVAFLVKVSRDSSPSHLVFALKAVLVEGSAHFRTSSNESSEVEVNIDWSGKSGHDKLTGDPLDFEAFETCLTKSETTPPAGTARSASLTSSTATNTASRTKPSSKWMISVTVEGCSYATVQALLFFLHGGNITFLPLLSSFLIAFQDDPPDSNASPYSAAARNAWLAKNAKQKDPTPCSSYGLYRLADRWMLEVPKGQAKEFILKGLTIENVAYEAFSQLSRDFEDLQKPILDFLLKHWKEVKATRAWSQTMELLEEGELPGGAAVLRKVHDGLGVVS